MIRGVPALLFCLMPLTAATAEMPATPDPELREILKTAIEEADSFQDRFAAEVWLMDMSNRLRNHVSDPTERLELLRLIHHEASRAKLPPELVLAVIDVESDFNRFAISRVGAQGLMQIMPFWMKEIGHPDDNLFHARTNLRMGCTILKFYLDKENGDLPKALARYNGSTGRRVYSDKVLRVLSERWFRE